MDDDIVNDPEFKEWAEKNRAHVLPRLRESSIAMLGPPEEPTDVQIQFALELGMSIMWDKPIIAVVQPGTKVPEKLVLVADKIVDIGDLDDPAQREKTQAAIQAAMEEIDPDGE